MEALKRANDIRVRRAQLKKDLKTGAANIDDVLQNPPDYVSTAKVFDILMAVPKFGRVKAARFLNQCRISQSKTVGGLSERQRAELIGIFITAPNREELERRLRARGTESEGEIEERLAQALKQSKLAGEFAYTVVNDQLGRAIDELEGIVRRELAASRA